MDKMLGSGGFFAGAGIGVIRFSAAEFPFHEGRKDCWTGVHDALKVRTVIVEKGVRAAIVSVETVILDGELSAQIKEAVADETGVPPERVWLCATHTVSAPHLFVQPHNPPEENERALRMRGSIIEAAARSAARANASVRPARLGVAYGVCHANVNRNIPTRDGWWLGSGEEFETDPTVPVVRLEDEAGAPIAFLYSFACELAVMDGAVMSDGGRHITADLSGAASAFVESAYAERGAVALFLPGVSTDQGPLYRAVYTVRGLNGEYRQVDLHEEGWLLLRLLGERLGEQVLLAGERAECAVPEGTVQIFYETNEYPGQKFRGPGLKNPMDGPDPEWRSIPDGTKTRSVEALILGELALLCAGGVGVRTARRLVDASPFRDTMIVGGVNGAAPRLQTDGEKYIMEKDHYERGTFGARNSGFGPGAAEKLTEDAERFLRRIYKERVR